MLLTLKQFIENLEGLKSHWFSVTNEGVEMTNKGVEVTDTVIRTLCYYNNALGVDNIRQKLFKESKNNFYICGLLDEVEILQYNSRFFDFGLLKMFSPILSDNEALIQRYAKLRYRAYGKMPDMDFDVAKGRVSIWCNTVQFFMENNTEGIERNLNIIETKVLHKADTKRAGLIDDYEFYKALYERNKPKMEEVLEKLVSPKIHKKRSDEEILGQYFSFFATGYAKLAWRKGIEVEVNSPLVAKELLPILPNDNYDIPYDFLK